MRGRNRSGEGPGDSGGGGRLAGQWHRHPPAKILARRAEVRDHPEEILEARTNGKFIF